MNADRKLVGSQTEVALYSLKIAVRECRVIFTTDFLC